MKRRELWRTALAIVCLAGLAVSGPLRAAEPPSVEALIQHLKEAEQRLEVLYVEGEMRSDDGTLAADGAITWRENGTRASVKAWRSGRIDGPFRLVDARFAMRWIDGPSGEKPFGEELIDASFDGRRAVVLRRGVGVVDKMQDPRMATISVDPSMVRQSPPYMMATGGAFSANFWGHDKAPRDQNKSLSVYLSDRSGQVRGRDANGKAIEGAFATTEFAETDGVKAVKLAIGDARTTQQTLWLDPARGYAVLRCEMTSGRKRRRDRVVVVPKFAQPSEGVWYPTEAELVAWIYPGENRPTEAIRYQYRASKVMANTAELAAELAQPLSLPAGTWVQDEVERRTYEIAPTDGAARP